MDVKKVIEMINEIAAEVVKKTQTNKDDLAFAIWESLWKKFGPMIFSGEAAEGSYTDNLPAEAVGPVEGLVAKIEAGGD